MQTKLGDSFKNPGWKCDECLEEVEYGTDCDSQKPEGKQNQPYDRIKDQSQKSYRPTQNQKNQPKQYFHCGFTFPPGGIFSHGFSFHQRSMEVYENR